MTHVLLVVAIFSNSSYFSTSDRPLIHHKCASAVKTKAPVVKKAEFDDKGQYIADPTDELAKLGMVLGSKVRFAQAMS